MILNTIIAVVVILILISLSGWVAAFLNKLTPYIYFILGIFVPINQNPNIEYNKSIVIIFALLWAYKLLDAANKNYIGQMKSHVPQTVIVSMSGFIVGCLLSTCFNIFIYFFPDVF